METQVASFVIGVVIGVAWSCLMVWLEYGRPPSERQRTAHPLGDKSLLSDDPSTGSGTANN
jgi:MFS superfamily sulfate permease-like transporter